MPLKMSEGESYIVLFHTSQFDCFLFVRDIRELPMTPGTCQAYHTVVWDYQPGIQFVNCKAYVEQSSVLTEES